MEHLYVYNMFVVYIVHPDNHTSVFAWQDCHGNCHPLSERLGRFAEDRNSARNLFRLCDLELAPSLEQTRIRVS